MKSVLIVCCVVIMNVVVLAQSNTQANPTQGQSSQPAQNTGPYVALPEMHQRLGGTDPSQRIAREALHELLMLPYYSVFDNLSFSVQGSDTVVLTGQVVRPTLKSDAANVVKRIEGVERVENNIEVLPPAPMDDRIRRAEYRAIYGYDGLSRYSWGAVPSIHIIVNRGHVTLVGEVDNEGDKNMANIRARGVPGVFSVTNNLQVRQEKEKNSAEKK